ESTFGRRAVNDGKLVNRLRFGRRVTLETAGRVRDFINNGAATGSAPSSELEAQWPAARTSTVKWRSEVASEAVAAGASAPLPNPEQSFRFFDNRQKYLLFVNTCSEKWVIARRVAMELANIHPRPPAIR